MLRHFAFLLAVALLLLTQTAHGQDTEPLGLTLNADAPGPTINEHIYGHFAEHLGRDIYGGFWIKGEDGEWGLNQKVIDALREINPPNVRWPGGCFADYYHWRDGIGPQQDRPTIVNTLWGGITEDNSFGTHEYMKLVDALDTEPVIVGNVGSGTVEEMADWWEYLNHPGPSPMAKLRAANGRTEPYGVEFFGVGNESWGCGGNMDAEYYSDLYKRFATFLHPYGETRPFRIAAGPAGDDYEWMNTLMREAAPMIDGVDVHHYTITGTWADKGSATEFTEAEWIEAMENALFTEELIDRHSAIMDQYDPAQRVWLIFGEWGMWHDVEPGTNPGFLYQQNALRDALVAAISLNAFNNNAERVQMANIAQTINVLQAMILTNEENEIVLTPTYHVFEMYKGHQDATLVPLALERGTYSHAGETVPALTASASRQEDGTLLLTIANLDPREGRTVSASLRGEDYASVAGRILTADQMTAHNTFDDSDAVRPTRFDGARLDGDRLTIELLAKSIVALELKQ